MGFYPKPKMPNGIFFSSARLLGAKLRIFLFVLSLSTIASTGTAQAAPSFRQGEGDCVRPAPGAQQHMAVRAPVLSFERAAECHALTARD
jgi:hypothetical protein